jgi:hypothetical protein
MIQDTYGTLVTSSSMNSSFKGMKKSCGLQTKGPPLNGISLDIQHCKDHFRNSNWHPTIINSSQPHLKSKESILQSIK